MLTVPVPLAETIARLMTGVDDALGDDFSAPATLVSFQLQPGAVDFGMKQLPHGRHPVDALLGFVAPEEWIAFGAVAHGWAAAPGPARPSRAADRNRVRSFHVCGRDGTEVAGLHLRGQALTVMDGRAAVGMVPDVVRRCVGLATAPPDTPPPPGCDGWGDLRWDVVTGRRSAPHITPTEAAWMDDGLFSRFVHLTSE